MKCRRKNYQNNRVAPPPMVWYPPTWKIMDPPLIVAPPGELIALWSFNILKEAFSWYDVNRLNLSESFNGIYHKSRLTWSLWATHYLLSIVFYWNQTFYFQVSVLNLKACLILYVCCIKLGQFFVFTKRKYNLPSRSDVYLAQGGKTVWQQEFFEIQSLRGYNKTESFLFLEPKSSEDLSIEIITFTSC